MGSTVAFVVRVYDGPRRRTSEAMSDTNVDLPFLAKQHQRMLDETRLLRKEVGDVMKLVVSGYDLTRRVERRQSEMRDDLEVMIKMELGGALANVQTSIENSLARIEGTFEDLGNRVDALERQP
jgi:hypothetical protein